jgi:hypothetical protein
MIGIAKLLRFACDASGLRISSFHFGGIVGPEAERISSGMPI